MTEQPTKLQLALARSRAATQKKLEEEKASAQDEFDSDLIPDNPYSKSDAEAEMDGVIASIDILAAYRRWCGKMNPNPKGKTEGIKISCPIPGHEDKNPSAWINTKDQVWFCGGCQVGGDTHDLAAYHFGFSVPEYKNGANFHKLREKMAVDFGWTITRLPGNVQQITPPVEETEETEETDEPADPAEPVVSLVPEPESSDDTDADVIDMFDDEENQEVPFVELHWRTFVPHDSYIDRYMQEATQDDLPEEFHFWNSLIGLGFALGRDVVLDDIIPVYSNLFVCTLGRSGSGKSRAKWNLDRLLEEAMPHDWDDPFSQGVLRVRAPGSAEALIHNFEKPILDPANPKKILGYSPVRGLVDYNELSSLIGRATRMGNVTIPTLMQFYDMDSVIGTSSMTHGKKEAHMPFASAITTSQPKALRGLITEGDDASGFLNRWVFAPGKNKKRVAIGGVRIDMTPAVKPLQDIHAWAGSFGAKEQMTWSEEAFHEFDAFYHERIEVDQEKSDNDMLIRVDLLMKKLVLLFTANRMLKVVPLISVQDAIACYDYIIRAYGIPSAQIGNTLQNQIAEAVLRQAKKQYKLNKRGITMSSLARSLFRQKYPMEALLKTIDYLVKLDFLAIESSKVGSAGKPTIKYKYVP